MNQLYEKETSLTKFKNKFMEISREFDPGSG